MFFGWRMWKVCVVMSYGAIGFGVVCWVLGPGDSTRLWGVGGGVVLASLSYWPVNYTVSFLGGLASAGLTLLYTMGLGFTGIVPWAAAAAAFIMGTAFAYLNRQSVVILATSVLGAVLLVSGLTSWLMVWPSLYNSLRSLAFDTAIVVPFLLLVPTMVSCFYQIAEIRRVDGEQL